MPHEEQAGLNSGRRNVVIQRRPEECVELRQRHISVFLQASNRQPRRIIRIAIVDEVDRPVPSVVIVVVLVAA
jgi:hypothetical protein